MPHTGPAELDRTSDQPGHLPPEHPVAPQRPTWTFLTNHGHVLLAVAADPDQRINDIAATVGITPRATLAILKDLENTGYLHRRKIGRRSHYTIDAQQHFRHPSTAAREVGELLAIFTPNPED